MPVHWQSIVDFLVLAGAIYVVLLWAKQARAVRIAIAIILLQIGALVARNYDLAITAWVLSGAGFVAVAVLLIVFQPELRHAFMRLDTVLRTGWRKSRALTPAHSAISRAAFDLAKNGVGALIVLVRHDTVGELIQGGTRLGAEVSLELLEAIFQRTSPMHDGAVVVNGATIVRAKAVLPLTIRPEVPAYFGTRHRAAMGLAERSDAVVIAVSEERGTVSVMQDRLIHQMDGPEHLTELLDRLTVGPELAWPRRVHRILTRNLRFKFAALALAAAVWAIALFTSGTTVRTVMVPVVFTGVPSGMNVMAQSALEVEVQLRGGPLIMASAPLNRLTATFSLAKAKPGRVELTIGPENFNLPPGVTLARAVPSAVSVRLVAKTP